MNCATLQSIPFVFAIFFLWLLSCEWRSLVSLQNAEEVLALEHAILGHVGAMNGVLYFVRAELGAQRVRLEVLGNLGVVRTHKLTEAANGIFLSDFERDGGTI